MALTQRSGDPQPTHQDMAVPFLLLAVSGSIMRPLQWDAQQSVGRAQQSVGRAQQGGGVNDDVVYKRWGLEVALLKEVRRPLGSVPFSRTLRAH